MLQVYLNSSAYVDMLNIIVYLAVLIPVGGTAAHVRSTQAYANVCFIL